MREHGAVYIPDDEYLERVKRAAKILQREGLDALIVNSNESDYANARYFSGFWPLFERCGVAISPTGDAALMVGPESREFAADRSRLDKIFVLKEYREGADPAYPELQADTYHDVFKALGITGKKLTFISTDTFGVRWEKGIAVTESGCEVLSPEIGKLYELEF